MEELLILVDEKDRPWGKLEKLLVHQLGILHRAFSVFIFNRKGELLLQQRAYEKYHSPGLWTNTCCSHPNFGETTDVAVKRRLEEEMGMHCETEFAFNFTYKITFDNGLIEHEFDHVYIGTSDEKPIINKAEVKNHKYISLENLQKDVALNPNDYTAWFKICLPMVINFYNKKNNPST